MSDARQNFLAGLVRDLPEPNAPAANSHADPTLISGASEYVKPISRPDASTVGGEPGSYFTGSQEDGNRVNETQLSVIRTFDRVGRNTHTSPAGERQSTGF